MGSSKPDSLLLALKLKPSDKIIGVREKGIADANFILSHIMKEVFANENNGLCLVILHNTVGHYHNVGKRLDYDLYEKIEDGSAMLLEPLKTVLELNDGDTEAPLHFYTNDKEKVCKNLLLEIRDKLQTLKSNKSGQIYLMIDDLSHLLDIGIDLKYAIGFINCCLNLSENLCVVIGTHVSGRSDEILANDLSYAADVVIEVDPLKTGRSSNVTGVITVRRSEGSEAEVYHYKALESEIKTFRPGDAIRFVLN